MLRTNCFGISSSKRLQTVWAFFEIKYGISVLLVQAKAFLFDGRDLGFALCCSFLPGFGGIFFDLQAIASGFFDLFSLLYDAA
jgi:hypothetical protein